MMMAVTQIALITNSVHAGLCSNTPKLSFVFGVCNRATVVCSKLE